MPPVSARLGSERVRVSSTALEGRGPLFDLFRERKLLDYYLEAAALKNGLSLAEARLLLYLRQSGPSGRKELAEFTGLSRGGLSMLLKLLEGRELIAVTETGKGREKRLEIAFPQAAGPVLEDVEDAWEDYEAARLSGFSPEERERWDELAERVQENIRRVLQ